MPWAKGFSLLEVVVATILFTIVFGGFAASALIQEKALKKYRNHNLLRHLAESEIEATLSRGFDDLTSYAGTTPKTIQIERKVDGVSTFQEFELRVQIENKTLFTADIIVSAQTLKEPPERFELRTVAFKTL